MAHERPSARLRVVPASAGAGDQGALGVVARQVHPRGDPGDGGGGLVGRRLCEMEEPESLTYEGVDPVAGWERLLEIVVAPTGEAVRFLAATNGSGSAWLSRDETEELVRFLQAWLAHDGSRLS